MQTRVGVAGKTADTFNEVVALNQRMASELVRLRDSVGREGRINQRASLGEVAGTWAESTKLINDLIADLVQPTSEMARVIGAVAQGDLSKTMDLEIEGRPLQGASGPARPDGSRQNDSVGTYVRPSAPTLAV